MIKTIRTISEMLSIGEEINIPAEDINTVANDSKNAICFSSEVKGENCFNLIINKFKSEYLEKLATKFNPRTIIIQVISKNDLFIDEIGTILDFYYEFSKNVIWGLKYSKNMQENKLIINVLIFY